MTIVELLIAVMILLPLFTLGMQTFIRCMELSELAQNSSQTVNALKTRLADIENTAYNQIHPTYNNTTFTVAGVTGIGRTDIDNSDPDHLTIRLVFCWQERNGRIIGEDINLNGSLDAGEDFNGNGELDSIVRITTQISNI